MKLREILNILNAEIIQLTDDAVLEKEYQYISATDLMSDALALVCANCEETILFN